MLRRCPLSSHHNGREPGTSSNRAPPTTAMVQRHFPKAPQQPDARPGGSRAPTGAQVDLLWRESNRDAQDECFKVTTSSRHSDQPSVREILRPAKISPSLAWVGRHEGLSAGSAELEALHPLERVQDAGPRKDDGNRVNYQWENINRVDWPQKWIWQGQSLLKLSGANWGQEPIEGGNQDH